MKQVQKHGLLADFRQVFPKIARLPNQQPADGGRFNPVRCETLPCVGDISDTPVVIGTPKPSDIGVGLLYQFLQILWCNAIPVERRSRRIHVLLTFGDFLIGLRIGPGNAQNPDILGEEFAIFHTQGGNLRR